MSLIVIAIIYTSVLFVTRAVLIATGIGFLTVIVLYVGELAGVLPLETEPLLLEGRFVVLFFVIGAAGILLYSSSNATRTSLRQVQEHQQELLKRNLELEAEIAERQRIEANLRISEEKYRLLFENTPIMAGVYANDGEIILVNRAEAEAMGDTPEALQGRNLREIFELDFAESVIQDQKRVMDEGQELVDEGKATLPNGREIYFLRHLMPLTDTLTHDSPQILSLITDVTEKHLAQQRERELELARRKNEFLIEFFDTVSHDIKTPLTIMNTSIALLERAPSDEYRASKIAQIKDQLAMMNQYIQDILAISRLEHLPSFDFEILNLNSLIADTVANLRPRIEEKQIAFQFLPQPDLSSIKGNQDQLARLLTNLIENAVNYTPNEQSVTVKTFATNKRVNLEVADSGIGIDPAELPHIFDRFYRAANANSQNERGTGLGLAIVKKIVDIHAAQIQVQSQPGAGTTFRVEFVTAS